MTQNGLIRQLLATLIILNTQPHLTPVHGCLARSADLALRQPRAARVQGEV